MASTKATIERLLDDLLGDHVYTDKTDRPALAMDSLDEIEVVMSLEEEFGIEIPDEDCAGLQNFGQLVAYVERRIAEKEKS